MKKNIAIRVDADRNIGLGHLIRVKGFIFRNLNQYKNFLLITTADKKIIKKYISHKKIKFFFIKHKGIKQKELIYKILLKNNTQILLSDFSYGNYLKSKSFFRNFYLYFKEKKILCVSIDDPRQSLSSDLAIIPYPINKNFLNIESGTKVIKGIKYIPFNIDLFKKKKKINDRLQNILIVLSGFDYKNQTLNILKLILKKNFKINLKVTCNPKLKKTLLVNKNNNYNLELIHKLQNINTLLDWADLLITGEGMLRFEAAVKGVPTIFFNTLDNSKKNLEIIKNFTKTETASFLNYNKINSKSFFNLLNDFFKNSSLRKKQSLNGYNLYDLNGAKRINFEIKKIYIKKFSF